MKIGVLRWLVAAFILVMNISGGYISNAIPRSEPVVKPDVYPEFPHCTESGTHNGYLFSGNLPNKG